MSICVNTLENKTYDIQALSTTFKTNRAFINKGNTWHYLVLAIGIAICLGGVYLMFMGIKTIVDCLFDSNDD